MNSPYFRIFRATGADGFSVDTHAKFVFEPALESDELFDALRNAYPSIKTHSERKRQAVLDFLVQEREEDLRALDRLVNGEVNTTSPVQSWNSDPSQSIQQTPATISYDSFSPSNSTEASPIAITPNFKANSSASASTTSTTSTNPQFHVWNATGNKPIKLHKRRCMTDQEKEEYRQRRLLGSCDSCKQKRRKCRHYEIAASQAAASRKHSKQSKSAKSASTTATSSSSQAATHGVSARSSPSDAATQSFNTSPNFLDNHLSFDGLDMNFDANMTGQLFEGDFSLFPETTEPDFFNTMMDQPFHNTPDHFFQDFATSYTDNFAHTANFNNQPVLSDWLNAPALEALGDSSGGSSGDSSGSSSSSPLVQVAPLTGPVSELPRFRGREQREILLNNRTEREERAIEHNSDDDRITRDRKSLEGSFIQKDGSSTRARYYQDPLAEGVLTDRVGLGSASSLSARSSSSVASADLYGSVGRGLAAQSSLSQTSQSRPSRTANGSASVELPQPQPQRVPGGSRDGTLIRATRMRQGLAEGTHGWQTGQGATLQQQQQQQRRRRQASSLSSLSTAVTDRAAVHTRPSPSAASSIRIPILDIPEPLTTRNELRHSGHPLSTRAGTYSVFDFSSKKLRENERRPDAVSRNANSIRTDIAGSFPSSVVSRPMARSTRSSLVRAAPVDGSVSRTIASCQSCHPTPATTQCSLAPALGALAHAAAFACYTMSWYCLYVAHMIHQLQIAMTTMAMTCHQIRSGRKLFDRDGSRIQELMEDNTAALAQQLIVA